MSMAVPATIWILLGTAMLVSAVGYYHYIYFISIGYGYAIAAESIMMLVLYGSRVTAGAAILCAILILYGIRLGSYLLYREVAGSYRSSMEGEMEDNEAM